MTALHRAAIIGRDSMVRFLLKSGADVRAMDKVNSYTDLMPLTMSFLNTVL